MHHPVKRELGQYSQTGTWIWYFGAKAAITMQMNLDDLDEFPIIYAQYIYAVVTHLMLLH